MIQHGSLQQLLQILEQLRFHCFIFLLQLRRGFESLYQWLLQQSPLGSIKKKSPQWNFLAVFKTAGQIFKGKCFCACWAGQRQAGRGDAALWGMLYGRPGCGPAAVFWGNLACFALLCWWSAFLTVGMFLLSNAELLLGWIIHRVISHGRNFQHSIRLFFIFF